MSVFGDGGVSLRQAGANKSGSPQMSWRLSSNSYGVISPTFSVHMAIALDGAFDFVRLQYENDAAANFDPERLETAASCPVCNVHNLLTNNAEFARARA